MALKARTKIMRGLKDIESARLFTQGWLLYYNYLRPHESLSGRTPAQFAGVKYPYRNWQDIVAGKQIETASLANATSYADIPELPEGVKYTILRRRVIRRPKHKSRRSGERVQTSVMAMRG